MASGRTRTKRHEETTKRYLDRAGLKGMYEREFRFDYTSCNLNDNKTSARGDFIFHFPTHIAVLEVDERAHSDREMSCEVSRMMDIRGWFSMGADVDKPLVFFRFNPDPMRGVPKVDTSRRYAVLLNWLKTYVPVEPLEVIYMWYPIDESDGTGRPEVLDEIEIFHEEMLPFVRPESVVSLWS